MIRVVVIEDTVSVREGLRKSLGKQKGIALVGVYGSAEEGLKKLHADAPDAVICDIGLPGISGIDFTRAAKQQRPAMDVLAYTVFEDSENVMRMVRAGASGYLLKETPPEKMAATIRDLRKGGAPITPRIARMVLAAFRESGGLQAPSDLGLSKREHQILQEMVRGASYKEAAATLFVSPETVRTHIKHIYEKLHVRTRAGAVAKALGHKGE